MPEIAGGQFHRCQDYRRDGAKATTAAKAKRQKQPHGLILILIPSRRRYLENREKLISFQRSYDSGSGSSKDVGGKGEVSP